jgi:hypothetical protein
MSLQGSQYKDVDVDVKQQGKRLPSWTQYVYPGGAIHASTS